MARAAILSLLMLSARMGQTQEVTLNREYTIKAAFLYQFGNYIEWPGSAFADDQSEFVIGVLGDNPFGATLDRIASTKTVGGRAIAIRQVSSDEEVRGCHILFIPASASPDAASQAVALASGGGVLTVGETAGFVTQGGDVQFFVSENKVRFEINETPTRQRGLTISSKLLSLSKRAPEALQN